MALFYARIQAQFPYYTKHINLLLSFTQYLLLSFDGTTVSYINLEGIVDEEPIFIRLRINSATKTISREIQIPPHIYPGDSLSLWG